MANASPLLISGTPSTGKSTFGNWLEVNRGFVHLDVELENARCLRERNLFEAWRQAIDGKPQEFVAALARLGKPVVTTWGFPVACKDSVRTMLGAGLIGWWFTGDWDAARLQHQQARKNMSAFDKQRSLLEPVHDQFAAMFTPRVVRTVRMDNGEPRALPIEAVARIVLV